MPSGHYEPWRNWYNRASWRKRRAHQLRTEPMCRMHAARGIAVPATIADHIESHGGDWNKFRLGKLQSLCKACHDSLKRLVAERGYDPTIGADGWPIDRQHPIYRA